MKLDESIEMKNLNEKVKIKYLPIKRYRMFLSEIRGNDTLCECLNEVLRMEGFLPETLNEGETYEDVLETLMTDEDIVKEIVETSLANKSECGAKIRESLDTFDYDVPKNLGKRHVRMHNALNEYPDMVKRIIPTISSFNSSDLNNYFTLENPITTEEFVNFLRVSEGENNEEYFNRLNKTGDFRFRKVFDGLVNPRKRGFISKFMSNMNIDELDEFETVLNDIFVSTDKVLNVQKKLEKSKPKDDDIDIYDTDDDDFEFSLDPSTLGLADPLYENINANGIKGKGVDSQNKKYSKASSKDAITKANKTQKTVDQKVDNLKNQKYENFGTTEEIADKNLGRGNALDLDYNTVLDSETKKRFNDLAKGEAPKDHANVDHDSKTGQKMIDAAKARSQHMKLNYTSKPARTGVEDVEQKMETKAINEEIDKIKRLFNAKKM